MANANDTQQGYAPFDLYPYNPVPAPAYLFLALFGIAALLHLAAMIPYRSAFPLPLVIGSGMEAAAYYFRSRSHNNVRQTLPFLLQNLLLLAAPPFLAASIYMSPRRIARVFDAEHLLIKPRVITKLFVVIDIACFVTQVAGSIMSGSEEPDQASLGKTIIVVGLALQIVAFGFFTAWTAHFHKRLHSTYYREPLLDITSWKRYVFGLYAISILFAVRNVTRLIEYNQGSDGEMLSNEAYLYVLDSAVMLVIVVIFLVLHPGRLRLKARRYNKKAVIGSQCELVQVHSSA